MNRTKPYFFSFDVPTPNKMTGHFVVLESMFMPREQFEGAEFKVFPSKDYDTDKRLQQLVKCAHSFVEQNGLGWTKVDDEYPPKDDPEKNVLALPGESIQVLVTDGQIVWLDFYHFDIGRWHDECELPRTHWRKVAAPPPKGQTDA